jgi:predicted kinase
MLTEGQHNKAAMKFVFLAGGPGSGKNYIAEQLFKIGKDNNFSADGLKLISFDRIFENELRIRGYEPSELNNLTENEEWGLLSEANPKSVYRRCRDVVKKQLKHHIKQGDGIIFDGTGQNLGPYFNKKDEAEYLGYDTFMFYVECSTKKALERNAKRARKLPESLVAKINRSVQYNKKDFQKDFGKNMVVINNEEDNAPLPPEAFQLAHRVVNEKVQNVKGRVFLKTGKRPWVGGYRPKLPKDIDPNAKKYDKNVLPSGKTWMGFGANKDFYTQPDYTKPAKTYSYSPPKV